MDGLVGAGEVLADGKWKDERAIRGLNVEGVSSTKAATLFSDRSEEVK